MAIFLGNLFLKQYRILGGFNMAEVGAVGSTPSASGVQRRDNTRTQGGPSVDEPIDFSPFGPDEEPDPEMVKFQQEQEARNNAEAARIQRELKASEERQSQYEQERGEKYFKARSAVYLFRIRFAGDTPEEAQKFLEELEHNFNYDQDMMIQEAEKLRQEEKDIKEMYNNLWWVKLWRWITGK